jgi:hypothetical protein
MYDGDPDHPVVTHEFRATKASVSFISRPVDLLDCDCKAAVENRHLAEVVQLVESNYVTGVPPHRLRTARSRKYDPSMSCIFVTPWTSFQTMSALDIQKIFRHRHILVLDAPVAKLNFDRDGLETMGSLHTPRTVQSMVSFLAPPTITNCMLYNVTVAELRTVATTSSQRPGTLEELRIAVCEERKGRILNILDLPMGHISQDPPPQYRYVLVGAAVSLCSFIFRSLASHEVAWQETRGRPGYCIQQPLADDLSWGTAATNATTSWLHQDDDGFATAVTVKTGAKWWVVMKPRKDAHPDDPLGNLRTSKAYPADWDVNQNSGKGVFDAEAVLLSAGSVL